MFEEIIEYQNALDEIKKFNLTEAKRNRLLHIIIENPNLTANKILEIVDNLIHGKKIILDSGVYSADPVLNEGGEYGMCLMEFVIPAVIKHIPREIIGYLGEVHAKTIIDKILDIEFDKNTTPEQLKRRIDEMFTSGDITIPVQGLNRRPETNQLVLGNEFGQRLYKAIQFGKEQYDCPVKSQSTNTNTLRYALKDYKLVDMEDETPLMKILPQFVMVLKNLLGGD